MIDPGAHGDDADGCATSSREATESLGSLSDSLGRALYGRGCSARAASGLVQTLRTMELGQGSHINLPIAVLIWLMIVPMMMKVDFASIRHVGARQTGLVISLFGAESGAALATVVGVLVEVPVMLSVCGMCNRTRHWFAHEAVA